MKAGDKVYCVLDNYIEVKPNNFVLAPNAPISSAITQFKPYIIIDLGNTLAINNDMGRWILVSRLDEYFITEKEFRKYKLKKLNENWR